jgi:hypothetical protein
MNELERLVIETKPEELVIRVLYRSKGDSSPSSKARRREVTELTKAGLRDALAALEGDAEVVGTSGFTTREDLLSVALPGPDEARKAAS